MSSKPREYCKRGHLMAETRRQYGRSTCCAECMKITAGEYYATYKDQRVKSQRRYYEANREKVIERTRRHREKNPEKWQAYAKQWHQDNIVRRKQYYLKNILKKQYGLTVEQYQAMLAAQHGVCAICKKPPTKRRLDVDHDHADGHVRQLLCERCNKGLGCFEDSLQLLETAVRYMRKHSQLRLVG